MAVQGTPAIAPVKKESVLEHPLSVAECPDPIKQAIETAESSPIVDGIIAESPYYMCYMFKKSKGELVIFEQPYGWNASAGALEKLKIVEPLYASAHYKALKTYCVGNYVVSVMVNNKYRVCYYKTDGPEREYDESALPEDVKREIELKQWLDNYLDNEEDNTDHSHTEDATTPEESEWVDNAVIIDIKPSDQTKKKDPRRVAIIGTKGGDTRRWNSYRQCEEDLYGPGKGHGVVSQFFSGKMKTVKGWILKKVEESAE